METESLSLGSQSGVTDSNFEELHAILSAAGNQLPVIFSFHLTFDKHIGKGTSFQVSREILNEPEQAYSPYYVAVKRIIPAPSGNSQNQSDHYRRRNDGVARELRTIVKIGQINSNVILPIVGYGWDNNPFGRRPYIVADYSDHGTLPDYLQRITTTMGERREFALDVAVGLKVLHDNHIAHGDLKPSNILVFDAGVHKRSQIAKLADFGASIMESSEGSKPFYTGTPLYNAPERENRGRFVESKWDLQDHFYLADVWSLGLTIWEIMLRGRGYFEISWLKEGQDKLDFLHTVAIEEKDGILSRAIKCYERLFQHDTKSVALDAVKETFHMTLKDNPFERFPIAEVIKTLAQGTTASRPKPALPLPKSCPPSTNPQAAGFRIPLSRIHEMKKASYPQVPQILDSRRESNATSWPIKAPAMELGNLELSQQRTTAVHEFVMMRKTPWESQCKAFNEWRQKGLSTELLSNNYLRLAFCYHLGFGTQPDSELMMEFLWKSAKDGNSIAKTLYHRIAYSQGINDYDQSLITPLDKKLEEHADSPTFLSTRIVWYQEMCQDRTPAPPIIGMTDEGISAALYLACKAGNFSDAMDCCVRCMTFTPDLSRPTPLHWLIMFNDNEAKRLAEALFYGTSDNQSGPCRDYLNFFPASESSVVFMPEHCLELSGSPLHWAVSTNNIGLVRLLAGFGANVNIRWGNSERKKIDVLHSGFSPLDVAVLFHLPEMIDVLLELGAEFESTGSYHSAFHCIGRPCAPLERELLHGKQYKGALQKTISLLISRGFDINATAWDGSNPLLIALSDPDCKPYIIEGLLNGGADAGCTASTGSFNAAIAAAQGCISRRYNVSCLELIAKRVTDINALDHTGKCALHYAAVAGSEDAVHVLKTVKGFDVNHRCVDGYHSMYYAAIFDAVDVLSVLLELGVDVNISTKLTSDSESVQQTALMVAAMKRKKAAASFLLERKANPDFTFLGNPLEYTVLHAACASVSSGDSILTYLLTEHPILAQRSLVNTNWRGQGTALQKAAYFGDVDAVETLLENGADKEIVDKHGRTALLIVTLLLRAIKAKHSERKDLRWVFEKNSQAVAKLIAALEWIQQRLQ